MKSNSKRVVKVAWDEDEKKIFGAFPWNAHAMSMYEGIFEKISSKFGWSVQYGSKFKYKIDATFSSDIKHSDIEQFKNRNKQLYDVFVDGISSCDIFIADITNYNPNVFLELGIAIQLNKNVVIVTNQELDKLPFDIRGFDAKLYKTKEDLEEIINKEILIYQTIKEQSFDSEGPKILYKPKTSGILINHDALQIEIPKLKNLRIKLDFKFNYSTNHDWDWFGIHFRTQGNLGSPSELALIRYSGRTRSVTWPEQRSENEGKNVSDFVADEWHSFEALIDENKLKVWVHQQLVIEDEKLMIENFGDLFIRGNEHKHSVYFKGGNSAKPKNSQDGKETYLEIEYRDIQILDLNTTSNIFL